MSADEGLVARALGELHRGGGALLIDLEFTCWEDSVRTGWADPAHPAEIIEIGLAAFRVATRAVHGSFTTLVRPRVNPVLSEYCCELLHIPQREIDAADELPAALAKVAAWLASLAPAGLVSCGWGPLDRKVLASNTRMLGVADPLAGRPHIDLGAVMTELYRHPTPITRDDLRDLERLPPNPRRHRALDDALDLLHFLPLLLDGAPPTR